MIQLETGIPWIDSLPGKVENFLQQDVLEMLIDGQLIRGYRSPDAKSVWIRDYSDMMRGLKYFETDLKSVVQHFADTQAMNGRIFDYVTTLPEKLPCERENWTKYVRVPVEADVEFRFIKAAFIAWQATGDDEWIKTILPHIERAINYSTTHPDRWSAEYGLVKRPYTIDTWDFAYTAGKHDWLQFQIDKNTFWGIFHGDNSGLYESLNLFSRILKHLGNNDLSTIYDHKGAQVLKQLIKHCWNGRFFTHFVKINEVNIEGVDESAQLSMSNPMAFNRGVGTPEMAASMIREYQDRVDQAKAFAPWFSIDPPFPAGIFGDEKLIPGAYINGGIFPLAGAELALSAFQNGFERFALHQLEQYHQLIYNGNSFLWYFPDGKPSAVETSTSPDATPTDGWGSAAMLHALIEGLIGVKDIKSGFVDIIFCPRLPVLDIKKASIKIGYPYSKSEVFYNYRLSDSEMVYEIGGDVRQINAHLLIPEGMRVAEVRIGDCMADWQLQEINGSNYCDFVLWNEGTSRICLSLDGTKQ